ncbi:hypothetical protein [Caldalkalibacillus salinus]|uniref:hypothetical protein n=1 Tax=Caldalkalibacillus salinus TaxID=2803787 RepID=UPI00192210F6|nr:hypothetical protein [Caldalkalibacillus salinus]
MSRNNKKRERQEDNPRVELGGMGLYGTTTNEELDGYQASGDIENAGQLEHFKKEDGTSGSTASVDEKVQRD